MRIGTIAATLLWLSSALAGESVLNDDSFWRYFGTCRTEEVRTAKGLELLEIHNKNKTSGPKYGAPLRRTELPPEGWRAPDFDDSRWPRMPGRRLRGDISWGWGSNYRTLALLCLRARFRVDQPGEVKLELTFRGGAVVYVNGKEVARGGLPKGELRPETPAEDYPQEAYLDAKGRLLWGEPRKNGGDADRYARRERKLAVTIPGSALKKGVNVLALELHRAPSASIMFTARPQRGKTAMGTNWWPHLQLDDVSLTGAGAAAATGPRGFQVWPQNLLLKTYLADYGNPDEKTGPLRLVAARNCVVSGRVVAGADAEIGNIKGELKGLSGPGAIPASAVEVRYALPDGYSIVDWYGTRNRRPTCFDSLDEVAPARSPKREGGGALQPVWVTVRVPRDAKPGTYRGKLAVTCSAGSAEVPVELEVIDWEMPDSKDFPGLVGLLQSPDTLAVQYNVKMWSDEHWKLVERSLAAMGGIGAKTLYIPLIRGTHLGNQHSMVRWIRKGSNGKSTYDYDFSIAEKYVALAVKHMGRIPVVCVYCWESKLGSLTARANPDYHGRAPDKPLPFTVLDPATGKLTEAEGPSWGSPGIREFWKPVMDGVRGILAKHGVEKSMMIGVASDRRPTKEMVETLAAVAPGCPWVLKTHPAAEQIQGKPVGYVCDVWTALHPDWPEKKRGMGWKNPWLRGNFPRSSGVIGPLKYDAVLPYYYMSVEANQVAGARGFGHCGADFWPALKDKRGRGSVLLNRYPWGSWGSTGIQQSTTYVLGPGKNGPVPTARTEAVRAGQQAVAGRVFLEKALDDPAERAKLGAELEKQVRELLDDRHRAIMHGGYQRWRWFAVGWQDRQERLYRLCGEVAKKLGG